MNPTASTLFPEATAKPSHVRILRGYRGPADAERFHNAMRNAT